MTAGKEVKVVLTILMLLFSGCENSSPTKAEEPAVLTEADAATPEGSASGAIKAQEPKMIHYKKYFCDIGYALGCEATVERLANTATQISPLSNAKVVDEKVSSIEALIAKLRNELAGVTVVRSDTHPSVIHLIETVLFQQGGYPLEQRISLEYTGIPQGLLEQLHKEIPSLGPSTQRGISVPGLDDENESDIAVDASHELVRKILTDGAPARGNGEILFEAVTSVGNKSPRVEMSYRPQLFSLEEYLDGIEDALGVYATIERLADTKTHDSPLSLADVLNENVSSIDTLIAKLSNELEGVTIVRSEFNPAVIHLIETVLLENPAYPLEQRATVEYTGTLEGLLEQLHAQSLPIAPKRGGGIPMLEPMDDSTETAVNATDALVRIILVDAVPLAGYERILFEAVRYNRDNSPQVEVIFSGPKEYGPQRE